MNIDHNKIWKEVFKSLKVEHQYLFHFDNKGDLEGEKISYNEGSNHAYLHYDNLFNNIPKLQNKKPFIAHNHPKGEAKPSRADYLQCQFLIAAFGLYEIVLEDYLIYAKKGYFSFKEQNLMALKKETSSSKYNIKKSPPNDLPTVRITNEVSNGNEVFISSDGSFKTAPKIQPNIFFENLEDIQGSSYFFYNNIDATDIPLRIHYIHETLNPIEIYVHSNGDYIPLKYNGLI